MPLSKKTYSNLDETCDEEEKTFKGDVKHAVADEEIIDVLEDLSVVAIGSNSH